MDCKGNCLHCTEKCNTKSNTNQHGNSELKDEEIIKALECCIKGNHCRSDCPYDSEDDSCIECTSKLAKDTLDLINRKNAELKEKDIEIDILIKKKDAAYDEVAELRAEIERLQKEKFDSLNSQFAEMYATTLKIATNKAIKEFAERLKKRMGFCDLPNGIVRSHIDNLVNEMTEFKE